MGESYPGDGVQGFNKTGIDVSSYGVRQGRFVDRVRSQQRVSFLPRRLAGAATFARSPKHHSV